MGADMSEKKFKFLDGFKDYAFAAKKDRIIYKNKVLRKKDLNLSLPFENNFLDIDNNLYYIESQIFNDNKDEYEIYFLKKQSVKNLQKDFIAIQNEFEHSKNFYIYRFNIEKDKFDFLSRSAEDILNIPYNEILQMNLQDMITKILKDDWEYIYRETINFIQNETERSKSFSFIHKYYTENKYKWLKEYFTLYVNTKNQASYITGVLFDITEIHDENINSKNEIKFYKSIIDNNIDGAFKVNFLDHKIILNDKLASFINKNQKTEYSFQEISYHFVDFNFFDFITKKAKNEFEAKIIQIKNQKKYIKTFILKTQLTKKDELGNPSRMTGILIDIDKFVSSFSDKNENLFSEDVLEAMKAAIAITDESGTILYWSKHLSYLTGITSMDAKGSKIWDVLHILTAAEKSRITKTWHIEADIKEILRNGTNQYNRYVELYEIKHNDNTIKYIELLINTVNTGNAKRICLSAKDITAWFINEKSIENELEIYRNLIEYSREVYYYQDLLKSENDYVSNHIYFITGITPEDFLDLTTEEIINLVHPDEREIFSRYHLKQTVAVEKPQDAVIEYRIRNSFGKYSYISENIRIKYDEKDNPLYVAGNMKDITDSKIIENELYGTLRKYKTILNNHPDLIVKADRNNILTYVNKAFCDFFDMDESLLIGKSFVPLIYKDDRSNTMEVMSRLFDEPYECYIEQRVFSKNQWRWLAWKDKAILKEGEVVEIIGIGRDITEKKRFEQKLLKSHENIEEIIKNHPLGLLISDFDNNNVLNLNIIAKTILNKYKLTDNNSNIIKNEQYLNLISTLNEESPKTNFIFDDLKVFATLINYNENNAILQIFEIL